METLLIGMRFGHYLSMLTLCGMALFPAYALPRPGEDRRQAVRHAQRTGFGCAAIGLLSALGWLGCEAALMSGDATGYRDGHTLFTVLAHTQFGQVWRWRLVLLAVLALWSGWRRRSAPPLWPLVGAGIVLTVSLASIGHGAMGAGADRWLHLGNQALHLLAAAVWVGGLLALLGFLRRAPAAACVLRALQRFSAVGLIAVLLLLASGSLNAWFLVGSFDALLHTAYGRVLLVKLGFFGGMIGLAALNRCYLMPRLAAGDEAVALRLLRHSVLIEQACAILTVASVSVLGTLTPAFDMGRMSM